MGRAAAHHGAERDDGIVLARGREAIGGERQFECAGDPHQGLPVRTDTAALQGVASPGQQLFDNETIEPAGHDGYAQIRRRLRGGDFLHRLSFPWPSVSVYSTTSSPKPARPVSFFQGALSTRILWMPMSAMICAPIP